MDSGRNSLAKATKKKINTVETIDIPTGKLPVHLGWSEQGVEYIRFGKKSRPDKSKQTPIKASAIFSQLQRYFEGKKTSFNYNDLNWKKLTTFQKSVFEAAIKIPAGTVLTYAELATRIGKPNAARAVGTALGKNPWLILVPCHRIVGKKGLGGFSAPGGLKTKKWLLALENAYFTTAP